jgi:thioredoxin-like negative regulator of GroEL
MINRLPLCLTTAAYILVMAPQVAPAQQFNTNTPDLTPFQMLDVLRSQNPVQAAVDVNALTFKNQVLEKPGVVLVEFMLPTCGECDPVLRIMKDIVSRYDGKVGYLRLDIDKNPAIGEKYDIPRIPAILVFKDGRLLKKFAVFNAAQKDRLAATIDEQLDRSITADQALAAKEPETKSVKALAAKGASLKSAAVATKESSTKPVLVSTAKERQARRAAAISSRNSNSNPD